MDSEWRADEDWPFASARDDRPERLYDQAVERSRARFESALADGGLGQLVHLAMPDGRHASLRRLLWDLIEEYGRHTGHADALREAVDGRVGETHRRAGGRWGPVSLGERARRTDGCATARSELLIRGFPGQSPGAYER